MRVQGEPYRTIWPAADGRGVHVIDQTRLPHAFEILRLDELDAVAHAIRGMQVRGAPLIGGTAAYGVALAARQDPTTPALRRAAEQLLATRPTAVNLRWAVREMLAALEPLAEHERAEAAWRKARALCDADVEQCRAIGVAGLELVRRAWERKGGVARVNVLTHCNAGWLATIDWGTALAPIYMAHDAGVPVHVWVDETRPRNQGAALTAWELAQHGVPHTLVADNTGGHLMQQGMVDLCLVGADRVTAEGDVCNKVGTYLKALAAHDNTVPFYVALPFTTIDWTLAHGADVPIEERDGDEVLWTRGRTSSGEVTSVAIAPTGTKAANFAFDVTPARLVTAIVTERGVCRASRAGLLGLYPEERA